MAGIKNNNLPKKINKKEKNELTENLSPQHRAFCLAYIENGCNAVKAYQMVYPKSSYNSARANAARLIAKDSIKSFLQENFDELWENRKDEAGKTLLAIMSVAYSDITDIIDFDNGGLSLHDLNLVDTHGVKSIKLYKSDKKNMIKVVMHDKIKALELLCRIFNMFPSGDNEIFEDVIIIPPTIPKELKAPE